MSRDDIFHRLDSFFALRSASLRFRATCTRESQANSLRDMLGHGLRGDEDQRT